MPITNVDVNNPGFYLYPINNNRTAWKPFGLPVIMIVPRKYDQVGSTIENSMVFNTRIYIENVPKYAFVAGHNHVGLKYPDRELYSRTIEGSELAERLIKIETITRNGVEIPLDQAKRGDIISYTTSTRIVDTIEFIPGSDYYDLSDILLDVETLPSDNYNIVYETEYFSRIISEYSKDQFLCINRNSISLAMLRFAIQHPGQVLEEFQRLTPPPYLTNAAKSKDSTLSLYRPFTDILQDIMDEQILLERLNRVFNVQPEIVSYMSSLLGWDIPYFPLSLDELRKAVLRRTVEFQNIKGSRRSIINIFKLFGFEILITNLWWSNDGKRLIRPNENLPVPYKEQKIEILNIGQVDLCINEQVKKFKTYEIPLLYRPQIKTGLDNFQAVQDGGNITIDAYNVNTNSQAYIQLSQIAKSMKEGTYNPNCIIDQNGFVQPTAIHNSLNNLEINGYSQITLSGKMGEIKSELLIGPTPPLIKNSVSIDREKNLLDLSVNRYMNGEVIFVFASYNRLENVVPDIIKNLQSNRFDLQVLTEDLKEFANPDVLDFAIEFLYRLKAFHSILNVIRTRVDLNEIYQVTDIQIGGDYEQRYDTEIGMLQVPPAIIPNVPDNITDCSKLDPRSLGYKDNDISLRLKVLSGLSEEHAAWTAFDDRNYDDNGSLRLSTNKPGNDREECKFTNFGQDRILPNRDEVKASEYGPSPNANMVSYNITISPIKTSTSGNFDVSKSSANSYVGNFGLFTREYTDIRKPHCQLNSTTDYLYKGRVDDELLYKQTLSIDENYKSRACNLRMGDGVYWIYPVITKIVKQGTAKPSNSSRTEKIRFSGGSNVSGIRYYATGVQKKYLESTKRLGNLENSMLGMLYRAYNHPTSETIHYTNRSIEESFDQRKQLALQRYSLNIQKPTLHMPGCRFPRLDLLENDFTSITWSARPWDKDVHCGSICDNEVYLNYYKYVGADGNEYLSFDDVPYKILGNGFIQEMINLGDHSLLTGSPILEDNVIHKVFMNGSANNPAIIFDNTCDYDTNGNLIETDYPLFNSYCNSSNIDFIDGYPCVYGYQSYSGYDIGRSGLYDELMEAMGLNLTSFLTTYLFSLSSGIRCETGFRLDCNCLANCGTEEEQNCLADSYIEDGSHYWDSDHLKIDRVLSPSDIVGVCSMKLDGSIGMLELI